jgi:hypothetical protein
MVILCDRCKQEVFKYELCNYCKRKICYNCVKSSQRSPKTRRLVICRDCWGSMKKRGAFKNRKSEVAVPEAL